MNRPHCRWAAIDLTGAPIGVFERFSWLDDLYAAGCLFWSLGVFLCTAPAGPVHSADTSSAA